MGTNTPAERHAPTNTPLSFAAAIEQMMGYGGNRYPIGFGSSTLGSTQSIGNSFDGYVSQAYQSNGVVFACEVSRLMLFTEAQFQYRRFNNGRPGDLFGDGSLGILHRPWPGGTASDLLAINLLDADFAGNAFTHRRGDQLVRLRPDWTTLVFGSNREPQDTTPWDLDARLIAYLYQEGGTAGGKDPVVLDPRTVSHFMPLPDPLSPRRGMSWLTPVLREVMGDAAATDYKSALYENGAVVNLSIEYDAATTLEVFNTLVDAFGEKHEGLENAYKTLHLLGGHAEPLGLNFTELDFKGVQGAGETRIAAAANVPPVIVGLSEGLQAATYSNYSQARRRFADLFARPMWRSMCGSLEAIVPPPSGAELWYDDRDIAFLREDSKERAETQQLEAVTIKQLIDAGYKPETVVAAVTSGDYTKLVHTGLYSVQLQPPMPEGPPPAAANGEAAGRALAALIGPHLDATHTIQP